ncbi:arginine N-succinyltransferase [Motiliproteus sp. SC1-56]|uniref:arginine N-succinyltransferase n=1 Tax=Motiliproteus sp. SC1-56 TaxID=2799565 RepID=UPI001A8E1682|nr:arginine N-succinyltransferase [Motiliproteus sp. SC1-56]
MIRVRPIREEDFPVLMRIAEESGPGFTSLPAARDLLEAKIGRSLQAMGTDISTPGDHGYLFMMEESRNGEVIGTTGIEAAVGMRDPWYHYRIGTIVHASRELAIHNQFQTLYLCNDYTGHSEVCTLYLLPRYRRDGNGTLLSKCRFLFMAQHLHRFAPRVIAEMRGVSDERGRNPFWEGLGRHFFTMEFSKADFLTGIGNKAFIAELMPKHSIYIHLLPPDAQAVIGEVHAHTRPARRMLEDEGFHFEGYVDIFDGGPTLVCRTADVRSIRHSRLLTSAALRRASPTVHCLVSNTHLEGFRCILAPVALEAERVLLTAEQTDALELTAGAPVRVVPLQQTRKSH